MKRKTSIASIRRQMIAIERALYGLAKTASPEKAHRLGCAADLLIEARAVDLHRLRI